MYYSKIHNCLLCIREGSVIKGVWVLDFLSCCMCGSHDVAFPWVESQLPSLLPACSCMRSCCSSWQSRTDFTDLYITQSSANSRTVDVACSARSLMKIRKSSGPSTDPFGTPDFADASPDVSPYTTTLSTRTVLGTCSPRYIFNGTFSRPYIH